MKSMILELKKARQEYIEDAKQGVKFPYLTKRILSLRKSVDAIRTMYSDKEYNRLINAIS